MVMPMLENCVPKLTDEVRIIHARQVVTLKTRRGEIDTGGEGTEGVGFRVLAVVPLNFETLPFREVGHSFVAGLGVLVIKEETAAIAIAFAVVGGSRDTPRPFRVDFTE